MGVTTMDTAKIMDKLNEFKEEVIAKVSDVKESLTKKIEEIREFQESDQKIEPIKINEDDTEGTKREHRILSSEGSETTDQVQSEIKQEIQGDLKNANPA